MALVKNTNAYADLSEAETYFADRLDVAAWTAADDPTKSQALVTATLYLENMNWTGNVVSDSQALAFPREGTYFDPRMGTDVLLDPSAVPKRVIDCSLELAYHFLNNDGILDDTGRVEDLTVGEIELTKISVTNTIPAVAKRMITPLLINAGANSWFRAN